MFNSTKTLIALEREFKPKPSPTRIKQLLELVQVTLRCEALDEILNETAPYIHVDCQKNPKQIIMNRGVVNHALQWLEPSRRVTCFPAAAGSAVQARSPVCE